MKSIELPPDDRVWPHVEHAESLWKAAEETTNPAAKRELDAAARDCLSKIRGLLH